MVIIKLVNTIWDVPTTPIFVTSVLELLLKFLLTETPSNPPKFITNPISIPLLIKFMLGVTTISTPMVGITTLSDWVTSTLISYIWISTTTTFDILGEVELTQVW